MKLHLRAGRVATITISAVLLDASSTLSALTNRIDAVSWENTLLRAEVAAMSLELEDIETAPPAAELPGNIPVDLDLSNSLQKINWRMPVPFW